MGTESAAEDIGGDHPGGLPAVGAAQSAFDVDLSESWGVTVRARGGQSERHSVGEDDDDLGAGGATVRPVVGRNGDRAASSEPKHPAQGVS